MKKIINVCVLRIAFVFVLCGCATGCSKKDSGLYQIQMDMDANEALNEESVADIELSSNDQGSDLDNAVIKTVEQSDKDAVSQMAEQMAEVENSPIYVHVCGAVKNQGVYEFSPGDRVFQAVEAAGGFSEDASEGYVNQAMELEDGMKICIPTKAEVEQIESETMDEEKDFAGIELPKTMDKPSQESDLSVANSQGKININTADAQTLCTISGIGKTRAEAIISFRENNGRFNSIEEITKVSGIGNSTYQKIKESITVGE